MKTPEENNDNTKGRQPEVQDQKDDPRVKTVTPDNENGAPGPPDAEEDSSNKGQGPKGENL